MAPAQGMDPPIEVKVVRTHPDAALPVRGSEYAAGWDIRAVERTIVEFRSSTMVPTGLKVAIPAGYEGQIRARSSLGRKGLILPHSIGTIDADYRGEIGVILINLSVDDFVVTDGERIAQMIVTPYTKVQWLDVEELSITERGEGGFGSTGK